MKDVLYTVAEMNFIRRTHSAIWFVLGVIMGVAIGLHFP